MNQSLVLNRVPGLYLHSGTPGTNRLIIRGIGARTPFGTSKIRMFLGQIPLSNGEGETIFDDTDIALLESIQIISGPASSLYGAALSGVIRFNPVVPAKPSVFQSLMAGSYGTLRSVTQVNTPTTLAAFSHTGFDGFRENSRYSRSNAFLISQLRDSKGQRLQLIAQYIRLRSEIPSSKDSATFVNAPEKAAANWLAVQGYKEYHRAMTGLQWEELLGKRLMMRSAAYVLLRNAYELRPFGILREMNAGGGARSLLTWQALPGLKAEAGAELFAEAYDWQTYQQLDRLPAARQSDQRQRRGFFNIFSQAEWKAAAAWTFQAGLNLNQTRYRLYDFFDADTLDQSGAYSFGLQLSPRISAAHRLALPALKGYADTELRIAHGFSPPTVSETLTPQGRVNPAIQPESGWNFECVESLELWQKRLLFQLSAFYMPVSNLLVARRLADDSYMGVNAGRSLHRGLEFQSQGHLQAGPWKFSLWASASLGDFRFIDFEDNGVRYNGNRIPGVPARSASAGGDFMHKDWQLYGSLNGQWVSSIAANDNNSVLSAPWQCLNLRIGWKHEFGKSQRMETDAYAGINNLMNARYASMLQVNALPAAGRPPRYYYPAMPRNVYAACAIRWLIG